MIKPVFKPIPRNADELSEQMAIIQNFSAEKGIPSLGTTPPPTATVIPLTSNDTAVSVQSSDSPNHQAQPSVVPPAETPAAPHGERAAEPAPATRRLVFEIPATVYDQIQRRAFDNRASIRYVVLRALKADNITVAEADLKKDGRRNG